MGSRLILGIDNSMDFLNVALAREASLLEERHIKSALPPSQILPGHVREMLDGHALSVDDLTLIGVTLGPGSFTGMRVALAFSKGLREGLKVPLIGVPTLDILAAPFSFMKGHYLSPLIDAKKGEVFQALYRATGTGLERLSDYRAIKPAHISEAVKTPCLCFGTGARLCEEFLSAVDGVTVLKDNAFSRITGEGLIREALSRSENGVASLPQPIYGRRSEAEIKFNVAVT